MDINKTDEAKPGWAYLVGEGAVVGARAKRIKRSVALIGNIALMVLAVDVAYNFMGVTPSGIVQFFSGAGGASYREQVSETGKWVLNSHVSAAVDVGATPVSDFKRWISEVSSDPVAMIRPEGQATGNQYPCVPFTSPSEGWTNPATQKADKPRCFYSADGQALWIASYAKENGLNKGVLGVFRKTTVGWEYHDVELPEKTAVVGSLERVTVDQIAPRVSKDFPEAMRVARSVAGGVTTQDLKDFGKQWLKGAKRIFGPFGLFQNN